MNVSDIWDSISHPFDTVSNTYSQLTDAAKAKVKAWNLSVDLVRKTPVPNDPELIAWREDILTTADRIKRMILAVVSDQSAKEMGLGLGPLVVVGGVALGGILAYIATQMTDMAKYYSRLNFIKSAAQDLVNRNVAPAVALQQATKAADNNPETSREMKFLGVPVKTIGMGLVAVGILGFLLRRRT